MNIGVDFDNTIVCYDKLFHRESVERGLIPNNIPARKSEIRNYLRNQNKENHWTALQGYVYGPGIKGASPFPDVIEFFKNCRSLKIRAFIISHKTKFPYIGEQYNLHKAALDWLNRNEFFDKSSTGLSPNSVYFAPTKAEKLSIIEQKHCSYFIDDLPEFLSEENFPKSVQRILFDPNNSYPTESRFQRMISWDQALHIIPKVALK